ncbi:QueT transporter family protein [Desulfurococcus amylolyticus]|uniref:Putative membrane protein n=1 Tax=Desulfurococcus amylolyticus DSM 16532 TaxID=768672 RepID=I3XQK0_DESAM|nr:QueT transporter family protein [Desulfurococcus amylolyticus]AFL66224.1 putative membrane protein [Desulfurococcus amylolyticus DSM 16532]
MRISPVFITRSLIIAAVYTAVTLMLGYISYGELQFRVSDAMIILPLIVNMGLDAVIGLTIGGLLGNLASPFIPWDWVFGPLANLVASTIIYLVGRTRLNTYVKLAVSSILASLAIAVIVGYELTVIYGLPELTILYIFISELVIIGVIGGLVYRSLKVFFK